MERSSAGIWAIGKVGGFLVCGRSLCGVLSELSCHGSIYPLQLTENSGSGCGLEGHGRLEEERTPLRAALDAKLAFWLCLPPIGAVISDVSIQYSPRSSSAHLLCQTERSQQRSTDPVVSILELLQ